MSVAVGLISLHLDGEVMSCFEVPHQTLAEIKDMLIGYMT